MLSDRSSDPTGAHDRGGPPDAEKPRADGDPTERRAWIIVGVLGVVVVVLGVWLWAAGGDDGTEDVAGIHDGSTTTAAAPTSPDAGPDGSGDTPGSESPPSTLADEDPGGITVPEGASTAPVSVPTPAMDPTGITAVRVARHEGFDRVVFEFDQALPGYEVRYAELPVTEDGSGDEVSVEGPFAVTVRMTPASGVRFTEDGYEQIYTGPKRIPGQGSTVTEVVEAGDFESQATWAVGLADKVDFAVSTLESPSRLVIDFVNH